MSCGALGNWILARLDKPVLVLEVRRHRRSMRAWPYAVIGGAALVTLAGGLWFVPHPSVPAMADAELGMASFCLLAVTLLMAAVLGVRAVAGEQERGTLESLEMTPLSKAEIVDGKLLAMAARVLLVATALLPSLLLLSLVSSVRVVAVLPIYLTTALSAVALGYVAIAMSAMMKSVSDATLILLLSGGGMIIGSSFSAFGGSSLDMLSDGPYAWLLVYPYSWGVLGGLLRVARRLPPVRGAAWWTRRGELLCSGFAALFLTALPATRQWLAGVFQLAFNLVSICMNPFVALDELVSAGKGFVSATSVTRTWPLYAATAGSFVVLSLIAVCGRSAAISALGEERKPAKENRILTITHPPDLRLLLRSARRNRAESGVKQG